MYEVGSKLRLKFNSALSRFPVDFVVLFHLDRERDLLLVKPKVQMGCLRLKLTVGLGFGFSLSTATSSYVTAAAAVDGELRN